ncbi:hypothetical protein [Allomuricauda sp. R78024]|uniref:hypothetical protein n=1 Tax=Allomuricauda sp. R78024 TaxID=3093867 RepID=UPI0037C5651A
MEYSIISAQLLLKLGCNRVFLGFWKRESSDSLWWSVCPGSSRYGHLFFFRDCTKTSLLFPTKGYPIKSMGDGRGPNRPHSAWIFFPWIAYVEEP